jgi:hypothetical protein
MLAPLSFTCMYLCRLRPNDNEPVPFGAAFVRRIFVITVFRLLKFFCANIPVVCFLLPVMKQGSQFHSLVCSFIPGYTLLYPSHKMWTKQFCYMYMVWNYIHTCEISHPGKVVRYSPLAQRPWSSGIVTAVEIWVVRSNPTRYWVVVFI